MDCRTYSKPQSIHHNDGGLTMGSNNNDTRILAHLKQGKTITSLEAQKLFNCFRLSAVIHRLRKAGNDIVTHRELNYVSKGNHARYEFKGFEQ